MSLIHAGDCGIPHKDANELRKLRIDTNSRMINAKKSIKHKYPWMASIQRSTRVLWASNGKWTGNVVPDIGGGAIITNKAIVTAGHVLCVNTQHTKLPLRPGVQEEKLDVTCPTVSNDDNIDLNIRTRNHISVGVGTPIFTLRGHDYHANIQAFLYHYEPTSSGFSRNGDIGIVIKTDGLGLHNKLVSTICLPFPRHKAQFKDGLLVKLARWGTRYNEVIDPKNNVVRSSCMTNEARTLGDIKSVIPFDKREIFRE